MSEIQVLDRGVLFDGDELRAMWFRIRDRTGETRYRAVALRELAYLPIEAREDPDILGKQWAALRGLYNAGVDFAYTAMGVYRPRRVGVVQFYAAAAEARARDAAVEEALRRMAAVEGVLANYPQSQLRAPDTERVQWLIERLERLPRVLAILGHPDPRLARKGLGRDGSMGEADDELMSQQGETFLRGLAALEEDFVFAVMAAHVGRGDLARGLVKMARAASIFASRQRGTVGASFSIAIPLAAALAGNYGESHGRGDGHARSAADGISEAWGQHHSQSRSHTTSHSVTESEAHTTSRAETDFWSTTHSHAVTRSTAQTTGEADTESHTRSEAHTTGRSWADTTFSSTSHTTSRSTSTTTGSSTSWAVSGGNSVNSGVSVSQEHSQGTSWSNTYGTTTGGSQGVTMTDTLGGSVAVSRTRNEGTTVGHTSQWGWRAGANLGIDAGVGGQSADTSSHTLGWAQGSSASINRSLAVGVSGTESHSTTNSNTVGGNQSSSTGVSVSRGTSVSSGWSSGGSSFQSTTTTTGEATTTTRGQSHTEGGFESTTRGEAWGTAHTRSRATTTARAETDGWAETQGHSVTRGEAWTTGHAETRGEAWTEGETRGTSYQVARSHVEGVATAYSLARSGSRGFVGGFGGSVVPGFAITRSWQTEDDVAMRLTELARMLESLLNQASAEGGFLTTAVLLTTDRGAKAAAALVPQAFHGPNVPTPVLTVDAPDELRLHALTLRPSLEPDGDPFDAGLWTRWGTLLTPGMLAAYTAPNLFEEGTAVTVQERIPPMAFYPETEGEVVIGHQVSPETGRLTTTPLRLSRERYFHIAFIGDTGYGKSVAAERIAYETTLRWHLKTIVLDFGAGWRKMLNAPGLEGRVDIRQLSPGGPRPLRWNPLQIGRNILPEVQWRAFADIFGNVAKLGERRQIHELREALRRVYLAAGVLVDDPEVQEDPTWGRVRDAEEARITGAAVGTALRDLDREARQRLAVYRSRHVGLQDLYNHIEDEVRRISPRDIRRSMLEGILYRLHPLVQGAAARQYAAGEDAVDVNELVPGDWGVVVLEGGADLDEFSKAFLLAWAAYHFYTDAVVRRIRRARSRGWEVQIFFEEANKMLAGLDGKGEEGGPSTAEQFESMWRDSRKYGIALHVITQSPSQIPQGILSSCNIIVASQTKNPRDRDLVVAMIHRSEKGFVDEAWRRFIGSIPVGRAVVKLGYAFDRAFVEPVYVQPLPLDIPEPTDDEIAARLGEIRL